MYSLQYSIKTRVVLCNCPGVCSRWTGRTDKKNTFIYYNDIILFNIFIIEIQYYILKIPPMRKNIVLQIFVDIGDYDKDLDQFAVKSNF